MGGSGAALTPLSTARGVGSDPDPRAGSVGASTTQKETYAASTNKAHEAEYVEFVTPVHVPAAPKTVFAATKRTNWADSSDSD